MVLASAFFPPTTTSIPCRRCSALSCDCTLTGPSVVDYVGSGVGAVALILGVAMIYLEARPRWPPGGSKRPTGLAIISVFWILGGLYDIQSSAFNLQTLSSTPFPVLLVPAFLTGAGLALGLVSVVVAAGLLSRKRWSYKLGLALLLSGFAVDACEVLLFPDAVPVTLFFLVIAAVWLSVVWTYLRHPYVREFLGVGAITEAESVGASA